MLYRLNVTDNNVPKLNAVTISTQPVPAFTSEKELPIQGFLPVINNREYDMLPNGRELVMVFPSTPVSAAAATAHIHTVLNWTEELKSRVPVK